MPAALGMLILESRSTPATKSNSNSSTALQLQQEASEEEVLPPTAPQRTYPSIPQSPQVPRSSPNAHAASNGNNSKNTSHNNRSSRNHRSVDALIDTPIIPLVRRVSAYTIESTSDDDFTLTDDNQLANNNNNNHNNDENDQKKTVASFHMSLEGWDEDSLDIFQSNKNKNIKSTINDNANNHSNNNHINNTTTNARIKKKPWKSEHEKTASATAWQQQRRITSVSMSAASSLTDQFYEIPPTNNDLDVANTLLLLTPTTNTKTATVNLSPNPNNILIPPPPTPTSPTPQKNCAPSSETAFLPPPPPPSDTSATQIEKVKNISIQDPILNISGIYSGEVINKTVPHGVGIITYDNGRIFQGKLQHGKLIQGSMKYEDDKSQYTGQWFNQVPHGAGTMYYASTGQTFYGTFANGQTTDQGIVLEPEEQFSDAPVKKKKKQDIKKKRKKKKKPTVDNDDVVFESKKTPERKTSDRKPHSASSRKRSTEPSSSNHRKKAPDSTRQRSHATARSSGKPGRRSKSPSQQPRRIKSRSDHRHGSTSGGRPRMRRSNSPSIRQQRKEQRRRSKSPRESRVRTLRSTSRERRPKHRTSRPAVVVPRKHGRHSESPTRTSRTQVVAATTQSKPPRRKRSESVPRAFRGIMGICGGERKKKTAVTAPAATKNRSRNPVSAVATRLGIFRSKPKPTQNAATTSHTSSSTISHKAKPQQKQKPHATPTTKSGSKSGSNHNKSNSKVGKKVSQPKSRQKEKPSPNAWKRTFKINPPEKSDERNRPMEIVFDDFQKEDDPARPESNKEIKEKRLLPNEDALFGNSGTNMKSSESDKSEKDDVEIESHYDETSKKEELITEKEDAADIAANDKDVVEDSTIQREYSRLQQERAQVEAELARSPDHVKTMYMPGGLQGKGGMGSSLPSPRRSWTGVDLECSADFLVDEFSVMDDAFDD